VRIIQNNSKEYILLNKLLMMTTVTAIVFSAYLQRSTIHMTLMIVIVIIL